MRADLPGVEGTEQRIDAGIDLGKFLGIDQPARHAGLVTHDSDRNALTPELPERTPRTWHRTDTPRIGEIGHVFDQGSVPIEEDGLRLAGGSSVGSAGSPGKPDL